jgi:hypothetical protein
MKPFLPKRFLSPSILLASLASLGSAIAVTSLISNSHQSFANSPPGSCHLPAVSELAGGRAALALRRLQRLTSASPNDCSSPFRAHSVFGLIETFGWCN